MSIPLSQYSIFLLLLLSILIAKANSANMKCSKNMVLSTRRTYCFISPSCFSSEMTLSKTCTWGANPCIFGSCYKICGKCICQEGYTGKNCDKKIPSEQGHCEGNMVASIRRTRCSYSPKCRVHERTLLRKCTWGGDPCIFGACYKQCAECVCKERYKGEYCDKKINLCYSSKTHKCGRKSYCVMNGPNKYKCNCLPGFTRYITSFSKGDCRPRKKSDTNIEQVCTAEN